MASIRKRGKTLQVRYRTLAGVETSVTAPDRETAKRLKAEIERAHCLGEEWSPGSRDDADQPSLGEVVQAYLNEEARRLAPSTMRVYGLFLTGFLDHLREKHPKGRLHPRLLTAEALGGYFDALTATYSPSSAASVIRRVTAVWDWAFKRNRRFGNTVPYPEEIALPHRTTELRPWAPSWSLADQVVTVAWSLEPRWYGDLLAVQRYTGLRCSQVMRLQVSDFDLEGLRLHVRPEVGKTRSEKRGRLIPITPHLAEMIEAWGRSEGFLIDTGSGERAVSNSVLRRRWEKAGVALADLRQPTHAFRKMIVSELRRAGADETAVKALVGHKLDITSDVYTTADVLMPMMEAAVALIPKIGESDAKIIPLRGQGVDKRKRVAS